MSQLLLNRKIIITLIVISGLIATLLVGFQPALAAPTQGIELQSSVGYQGQVKDGKWAPARLTLTNTTDKDLKGEVVVSVISSFGGNTTDYVTPVELPKGTAVELTVAIPGSQLNDKNNTVRFFKGSYKNGELIDIVKGNSYLESSMGEVYTIGVIARDPDTLNFMPSLNLKGYNLSVIPLTEDQLPEEAVLYDYFNAMVINDVATSDWSELKTNAIIDWVRKGGTLILSGGAGYGKTSQAFDAVAPVKNEGSTSLIPTKDLVSIGGTKFKSQQPITVSKGTIVEGRTELSEGEFPLAVTRQVGLGNVVYVAFDPSLEPIASWSGSAPVYARLLQNTLIPLQPGISINSGNRYWNFERIVDEFPSIKPPNFSFLLWMFVIYMIIVAPVMYLILRKMDRREWTWWLVPTLSLITAVAIFYFGANDKRNLSTHTVQMVELSPTGGGVKSGAIGVFVPNGGTIKAEFDQNVHLMMYQNEGNNGSLNLDSNNQVITNGDSTTALWDSVSYWSTRKAWFEGVALEDNSASFGISYKNVNNGMDITITNNTPSDLTHAAILMNGHTIRAGDLKKGENKTVTIPLSTFNSVNNGGYYDYAQQLFSYSSNRIDEFSRQRSLVEQYMNGNNGFTMQLPLIVGFSMDHDASFTVNGNKVRADNLTMWIQKLGGMATEEDGRYSVPAGLVKPVITEKTMQRFETYGNGNMQFSKGELVMEFVLPNEKPVAYEHLKIVYNGNSNGSNVSWLIWNVSMGEWESTTTEYDNAGHYVSASNRVRMKMVAAADADAMLPQITLEGAVVR
ncbi:MAG: hypothetical protein ACE3L7_00475 [Candidatus Pristimantibacillus sp.]